jgi:anaerobic selenocysteine-containing dehydrogenase
MEREGVSRRAVLGAGVAAVAAAVIVPAMAPYPAAAQAKVKPAMVQYQQTPKNKQQCDTCLHWVPPDQCKMVEGKINPKGWCALYALKPK